MKYLFAGIFRPIVIIVILLLQLLPRGLIAQKGDAEDIVQYLRDLPGRKNKKVISGQMEGWGPTINPFLNRKNPILPFTYSPYFLPG